MPQASSDPPEKHRNRNMKTHAQAVVIGSGLIGCSIAYHLT
jgi:hypothetical protein